MHAALGAALAGMGLGLSLIVAIGAQNAYVLRQGLRREHVLPIVAFCAVSDAVLMAVGVGGAGAVLRAAPSAADAVRWVGAVFLAGYGLLSLRRALHPGRLTADETGVGTPLPRAMATVAAMTWLNPHVYLDTLLLVGSVAAGHGDQRWWFAAGAATGSVIWFTGLGFGARALSGLFSRPAAWRALDVLIGLTMLTLAVTLVRST
ncbi:MAG: LysE/ArgO family amino acid transporter [Thermoleophilia bacterium]